MKMKNLSLDSKEHIVNTIYGVRSSCCSKYYKEFATAYDPIVHAPVVPEMFDLSPLPPGHKKLPVGSEVVVVTATTTTTDLTLSPRGGVYLSGMHHTPAKSIKKQKKAGKEKTSPPSQPK
jgi:hypothetical protein